MASSIQEYKGIVERFNDLDLIAVISLVEYEVKSSQYQPWYIHDVLKAWVAELEVYGPGVIDLRLNELLDSSEIRQGILLLFGAISRRVKSFGVFVPGEWLNNQCRVAGVRFVDYPVVTLESAIARLVSMLSGAGKCG